MIFRALMVVMAVAAAGQGAAESPMPDCVDTSATGEQEAYTVLWHDGGFVFFVTGDFDGRTVVHNCQSGRRLVMLPAKGEPGPDYWAPAQALEETVMAALTAKRGYSMGQIAGMARKTGAKTRIVTVAHEVCGCALQGEAME